MTIIVVGGIKGGSGKTTIATNLAIMKVYAGKEVLLVDADDQETAADFSSLRNELVTRPTYTYTKLTETAVRTEVLKQVSKYNDIIIDTGGRDTSSQRAALSIADYLLVPFVPRSFDVWTLSAVGAIIKEMRPANTKFKAFSFLNRADSRGSDNTDAQELLNKSEELELIDVIICSRKIFGNAAAAGKSIFEVKARDMKAEEEIQGLYNKII